MTKKLVERLNNFSKETKEKAWEGTLEDYIEMVIKNPSLSMNAHQRMLAAIESAGVERDDDGKITSYSFFKDDLFGIEEPIEEIMSYLRAAATGSEVGRRILLMYGPTSSGKSQLAILLKKGLEKFTRTDEGAIYALADSPMFEDPLWAIPHDFRDSFKADHGVDITGELSPLTAMQLREKYDGDFMKMPVRRVFFSERDRIGIGTFVPSDKKSQDISELIGSMDLSAIGEYGSESDPRAYRFDGELNVANRGMMEFVEMLKVDQKFLYVLLTLAQEKKIKTARYPLIHADELLISHTNETEYRRFLAKEEMEALHDRIIVVKVPYNLCVDDEVKIYEKLISQSNFGQVHIAPHTLECAAMFSILSRLKESKNEGLSLMNKMMLYNHEEVDGFSDKDLVKIRSEIDDEGMSGISPRYIINRLSSTLAEDGKTCVTPIDIIRSLRDGFKSNPKLTATMIEQLNNILTSVIEEYSKKAQNDVQKAFFVNFEDEINNLLNNYMDHVEAYLDGSGIQNEWGDLEEPSERLMRSIEEKINVTDSGKKQFRHEIFRKMLKSTKDNDGSYNYKEHPKLREALEKQLFEERQDVIRLTVTKHKSSDDESLKKINVVIDTLCEKHGYTVESANKLLKYVNSIMARN